MGVSAKEAETSHNHQNFGLREDVDVVDGVEKNLNRLVPFEHSVETFGRVHESLDAAAAFSNEKNVLFVLPGKG